MRELRPHQIKIMDELRAAIGGGSKRVMISSPTGSGKCLGLGTPVMRFDGSIVPVEAICPGDALMGPDSKPRYVKSTCRGFGELFLINPTKGSAWVCNDVHVLTLVNITSNKVVDVPLDEYLGKTNNFKWVHKQFSPANGVDFANPVDPDIDPYWLGLWVGDGTKALNGVSVSKPDNEVYESCLATAEAHGLSIRTDGVDHGCPTHHLRAVGSGGRKNPLLEKLRDLFGHPAVSFPLRIKTSSRLYRQEFLAGAIDSDGYVSLGCVEIAQKNIEFAEGIAFVARSLGLKVTVREKVVNGTIYQRMILSGDFVGIETRIPRKKIGERKQIKTATRTGFSVASIGPGQYAGFEIDGDGRFLLGDFTVTHNTRIAAEIVNRALAKGNRVCFCVPAISLISQTFDRFREDGIDAGNVGIIQADHPWTRPHAPVQIASAQTLARRELPITDIVVCDEAHIRMTVYERWMQAKPELPFIGLSATPWATGLGKLYDTLIKPVSLADLIEQGYLSPFRAYAPSHPDLSGVKISHGDYQEDELGEAMSKPTLVADVVATWLEKGRGRPTLCFAVNRNHAAKLAYEFNKAGVRVAYVDAFTTREEREEIGRQFHASEVEVVVNIGCLTTGIDWDVRCISMARPTKSEMLMVQIFGRGLRTALGKSECLFLDHSDTLLNLGLPTEIHHDRLSMGKADDAKAKAEKDKKPSTPKVCKACACLLAPRQRECGECGMPQFGATGVVETAGELVELGAGKGRGEKPKPITERLAAMGKREIYGMLKSMERRHGWKHGVIEHRFRDIFGVWARGLRDAPAIEPCFELQSWVRSRNIAFAKSKGRVA